MSDKDGKDIMSDVINDISSAADAAAEETQDAVEVTAADIDEAADEAAEAGAAEESAEPPADAETIIVAFDDELDAARAVRVVNKALRQRNETIYQGAMISRDDDELTVEDLRDMGLTDVVTGTAGIGLDLGRDGFKLALSAATTGLALIGSSFRLLRKTALLTAGLAGSTVTIPVRRGLTSFDADEDLQDPTTILEPGNTAVVIVADHETAAELATDLVRSGGTLV